MKRTQMSVREALVFCRANGIKVKETRTHYQILRPKGTPVTIKKDDGTRPVSPKIRSLIRQLKGVA